ncbi:tRNA lysidine(34) synthetase TilS [Candidatus Bipolaricaulota bacterium]
MLEPGDCVFVAVSGGVDSVVLLHVLQTLVNELDLTLAVGHLNHGWRDDASEEDARFVESLAEEAGLQIVSERVSEEDLEPHSGLGREGAAREVRLAFLEEAAAHVGATKIAVGHTANDRAETVLFNLTRGAGGAGLAGIDAVNGPFIRPLIAVTRRDVLAYAEDHALAWREDQSNADLSFARNRIRHRVLPELEAINPRSAEAICRAADLAVDGTRVEELLIARLWPEVTVHEEPGDLRLDRAAFAKLPPEAARVVLREAFRHVRGDLQGIELQHVDTIVEIAHAESGHASADLPRLYVRVDRDAILLSSSAFSQSAPWESPVEPGKTRFPERGFSLDLRVADPGVGRPEIDSTDRATEFADADRVAFPLHVRNRRVGDRFTPLGMGQPVSLKRFLINERIPYFDRDDVPLLCDREKILWVAGVRLSNEVRITDDTKRLIIMRMETAP